ncbi:MAG: exodeoxyribonuclease VII large subunit, partial [Prevotella sp.]|nr:exodeoxyribonuclease VII large subunit [Prevotella sp.]
VNIAFPDTYWVEAELMEIRSSRGHCYMELVQKDVFSSAIIARAPAKCWRTQWVKVSSKFVRATGGAPRQGMKLLLQVSVDFHAAYGFALIVSDIDPAFTLGELARKREETIRRLKEEGVYDLQKELRLPLFCQRIAVISSATAAGYGDFCNQMTGNERGLAFRLTLFPAVMQGEQTAQSIIARLEEIGLQAEEYDCVVIIRGGGATADMSCFDGLELAENVANFPLPVITGIGHERDECVLDLVAYYRAKTPTAVAAFLVSRLSDVADRVSAARETIAGCAEMMLERGRARLGQLSASVRSAGCLCSSAARNRLRLVDMRINGSVRTICSEAETHVRLVNIRIDSASQTTISRAENKLALIDMRLGNALQTALQAARHRLELLSGRIDGLNPRRMLERGYTLVTSAGRIIKEAKGLNEGDEITVHFADGRAKTIIKHILHGDN